MVIRACCIAQIKISNIRYSAAEIIENTVISDMLPRPILLALASCLTIYVASL